MNYQTEYLLRYLKDIQDDLTRFLSYNSNYSDIQAYKKKCYGNMVNLISNHPIPDNLDDIAELMLIALNKINSTTEDRHVLNAWRDMVQHCYDKERLLKSNNNIKHNDNKFKEIENIYQSAESSYKGSFIKNILFRMIKNKFVWAIIICLIGWEMLNTLDEVWPLILSIGLVVIMGIVSIVKRNKY